MQETHSAKSIMGTGVERTGLFSVTKANSEEVAILINDKMPVELLNYNEIILGRLQAFTLKSMNIVLL